MYLCLNVLYMHTKYVCVYVCVVIEKCSALAYLIYIHVVGGFNNILANGRFWSFSCIILIPFGLEDNYIGSSLMSLKKMFICG